MTLQVEHEIEVTGANLPEEGKKRDRRAVPIVQDDFVKPAMMREDRRRLGLDRPRDVRVGPGVTNPPE